MTEIDILEHAQEEENGDRAMNSSCGFFKSWTIYSSRRVFIMIFLCETSVFRLTMDYDNVFQLFSGSGSVDWGRI